MADIDLHYVLLSRGRLLALTHATPQSCCQAVVSRRQLKLKAENKNQFVPHHERDKVPRDFDLVYTSSLRHWISVTKIGLNVLAASVSALSAYKATEFSLESLATVEGVFVCAAPLVTVGFLAGANALTRPVLIRIYYNEESGDFIGVRRTFWGRLKQLSYSLQDISMKQKKDTSKADTWDSVSLNINNNPVFLLSADFSSLQYYNMHITGEIPQVESTSVKEHFY